MRTKIVVVLFFLIQISFAQRQGNEWINYGQDYFKIKTGKDDVHRVTYQALIDAGFDPSGVNPNNFQLIHRGEEVATRIVGSGDASFDPGDYIEFWGRKNDGTQDTELFYREQDQIHTYYNLFSDTTAFFLTTGEVAGKRMQIQNTSSAGLPQISSHKEEIFLLETAKFSFGQYYPIGNPSGEVKRSLYDRGQMFMSREIMRNSYGIANELNYKDFVFTGINKEIRTDGKPELTFQIVGFNNIALHNASVFVGPDRDNLQPLVQDLTLSFNNFGTRTLQINWENVVDGQLVVRVEVIGFDEYPDDRMAISYMKLRYPQQLDVAGEEKYIYLNPSNNDRALTLQNYPNSAVLYDVSDYQNPKIVQGQLNGTNYTVAVDQSDESQKLILKEEDNFILVQPERVTFQFEDLSAYDYYIISHPFLKQAVDGSYDDPVQAYVDYRSSIDGGDFNVMYADAPDLYDEFGYGEFTPLAIRRFMKKAYEEGNPEYLFIIGKSSRVDIESQRLPDPLAVSRREIVPTMGAPGSDIAYVEALDGRAHYPAFPVGRLSVVNAQSVANYLDKVKEKEATLKDSPWTKNFVQLSGGLTTDELFRFREFVDGFENIIEDDYLGAAVTTIAKQNNNAVQNFNISEQINKGAGFVTFFGHSSASFTDIDIGNVTDPSNGYDNQGKYPVFLVNGCRGGEIFFYRSFGENWLAAKDKGAVNFMAHSDVGIPNVLREYTENFYQNMADTLWMNKSVGHIQQKVILDQLNGFSPDEIDFAVVEQTVLQGDPAIPIFGHDKVDYIVREEDIFRQSVNGLPITAATPFFNLGVIVNNSGRTAEQPVKVLVRRTLSDGRVIELPEVEVPPVRNRDTIYYEISNQGLDVFGENKFEVFLDLNNEVDEGSEINNSAETTFFFNSSGTFNTYPINFSTLNLSSVTLNAQASDLKVNDKSFVVEIDTVDTFDSPWKQTNTLTGKGLVEWEVDLLPFSVNDTIQYYWRSVFEEDLLADPQPWITSTFTNIEGGMEGWGQTEFDQFRELSLSSISKDEVNDQWVFAGNQTDINVGTFGDQHPLGGQPLQVTIEVDGTSLFAAGSNRSCAPQSLNALAFDKDSGRPYLVLRTQGEFEIQDPLNCGTTPQLINRFPDNNFRTATGDDLRIKQYLDGVSEGDYVLLFSIGTLVYGDWTADARNQFERIGVSSLPGNAGEPVIIFGNKGEIVGGATVVEGIPVGAQTSANQTEISFQTSIFASTDSGTAISPVIGPVSQWGQLSRNFSVDESEDELVFEVRGRTAVGAETTLFTLDDIDQLDLSSIDPQQYPFVRLYLSAKDRVSATPPQLNNWFVSYQGVPEGVLTLQNDQNQRIELQNGEPFDALFKFDNISNYDFQGPLTVNYSLTNQNSGTETTGTTQIPAVVAGESVEFSVPITTTGQLGLNDFEIFVNPGDELEQYYTNNVIRLDEFLNVIRDEVNPAMDVTFDGVYIVDGDIVSPKPVVEVELRDNNPYLFKTDTSGVDIRLGQICDSCPMERINFSDPNVTYTPASEGQNFKVQFQPESLADGEYMFEVNAADASGVQAGDEPYRITFEVVSESSITHFYPYPNPFSTSTRFVFTLTGDQIPDQIKIQIFTVSGKLVREITQDEIGPIRVGNNITDYAWDGRDEFGDILANGTYIYRVQVKSNGQDLNHRGTSKDKAFNNDFGKLVIIR